MLDPRRVLKEFGIMFAVQMVNYCICCMGFIGLTRGSYAWTFGNDLVYAMNGYFLVKRVAKSDSTAAFYGYTLGGACGSVLAIWIGKRWMGL